jgi:hypothetical protein
MPCLFLVPQRAAGSSTARTIYGVFRTIVSVELGALLALTAVPLYEFLAHLRLPTQVHMEIRTVPSTTDPSQEKQTHWHLVLVNLV